MLRSWLVASVAAVSVPVVIGWVAPGWQAGTGATAFVLVLGVVVFLAMLGVSLGWEGRRETLDLRRLQAERERASAEREAAELSRSIRRGREAVRAVSIGGGDDARD